MQAKAYGFLMQFLYLLHRYYTIKWPEHPRLYQHTDSKSLLICIQKLQAQENPSLNSTLLEDWDRIHMIVETLAKLPCYELNHVKAHQDEQTIVHNLPLPAQISVEAEHLTGSMHRFSSHPVPYQPSPTEYKEHHL